MTQPHHIAVGGAPEGFDARLILNEVARTNGPVVHIARDDKRVAALRAALGFFDPTLPVLDFPGWDCLPYDRVSPNATVSALRMATLAALTHRSRGCFVLLTTISAACQRIPPREVLRDSCFKARVRHRLDEAALRRFLTRTGFSRSPTVVEPGDYAIRGGIVDIYPPGLGGPVRLDLFGDVLDSARRFDPATQRSTAELQVVEFSPTSEVILDDAAVKRFRHNYRAAFGAAPREDPLYQAISEGRAHQGIEHWLPFFHRRLESLLDYVPKATITLDAQADATRLARWRVVQDQYQARARALKQKTPLLEGPYRPIPPEQLYIDAKEWETLLAGRHVLQFGALPFVEDGACIDAGGRMGRDFVSERKRKDINLFSILKEHAQAKVQQGPVVIASYSEGARDRLAGLLADEGLGNTRPIASALDMKGRPAIYLAVWPLESGFETADLTVISEQDVLGERLVRTPRRHRRADDVITEARGLSPGDLVVHIDHGIGRFLGLKIVTAANAAHECLALEYAGGAKLYLPVENVELLSRFGHEDGGLDSLGGAAWQARKARLKQRIRDMADRLLRVAAQRALRQAPMLAAPPHALAEFAARFAYEETEGQARAIAEVLEDMQSGRPMDRLICGDVGFGKTEIALRAAFVAAMAGRQVALIAPTTLLVRQHFQNFSDRFYGFPMQLRALSRFADSKQSAEIRKGLADGTVDIVLGTHALLSKSVQFKNLGLVIVDEEQHFGVSHKERLKQLRSQVHVLTMTATPIPRTLQLSLSGVRDMSIIDTSPPDRRAIRTYVMTFDTITIREALLREHYRRGQSFYVVPRIADLGEIETFLQEQLPELRYVVAHGQLAAAELDRCVNAFYDGACDVLLTTSIIESGLDIATANTLVVHRADMFGLAQLYQIRGRVGRSRRRAYAYLTTRPRASLTAAAQKRLRLLGSLDSLGAGFRLASHDLDMRGAGNLLGEEQSGRINEVGYELYQSMLEQTVAQIKASPKDTLDEANEPWSPQINLGLSVLIPETYVPDVDLRMGLYRRLGSLSGKVELEALAAELIDRFGKLPREVNTLLLVVRLKGMCRRAGIARIDGGPRGATLRFHRDKFASPEGLMHYIADQGGLAKMRGNCLVIRRDWKAGRDRIRGAFAIARDLATLAGAAPRKAQEAKESKP